MIPGSDVVARMFRRCYTNEAHSHFFLCVSLKKLGFQIKQFDTISIHNKPVTRCPFFSRLIFEVLFFAPVYFSAFVSKQHFYINKAHIYTRVSAREHVRTCLRSGYKKYFVAAGSLVSLLFVLLLYGSLVGHQCDRISILSLRCPYTDYTNLMSPSVLLLTEIVTNR
jgi:hypothetical protein